MSRKASAEPRKAVSKPMAEDVVVSTTTTRKRKKPTLADIRKLEKAKDTWDAVSAEFRKKYDVDAGYINGILKKPMTT